LDKNELIHLNSERYKKVLVLKEMIQLLDDSASEGVINDDEYFEVKKVLIKLINDIRKEWLTMILKDLLTLTVSANIIIKDKDSNVLYENDSFYKLDQVPLNIQLQNVDNIIHLNTVIYIYVGNACPF